MILIFHYQCDQCDYFDHICMYVTVVFENHDDEYDDAGDTDGNEYGDANPTLHRGVHLPPV